MSGIVDGLRKGLAVSAKVVIGAVSALVSNAVNVAVASITNNTILRGLVDLDIDLARVRNGDEGVSLMVRVSQGQATLAKVIVRALEALVTDADNGVQADVAGGEVENVCVAAVVGRTGGRTVSVVLVLLDGLESVAWVAKASKAVAALAQIKVIAVLALPADAADGVQANIAVDVGMDGFADVGRIEADIIQSLCDVLLVSCFGELSIQADNHARSSGVS